MLQYFTEIIEKHLQGDPEENIGIVKGNVRRMLDSNDGMMKLMSSESYAGNADLWVDPEGNSHPCCAANFRFDSRTGRIYEFGNNINANCTFRIAMIMAKDLTGFHRIVNCMPYTTTYRSAMNLERTIRVFNRYERMRRV